MGVITDARIQDWQDRAGIQPAVGERAERLAEMSETAHQLIQVLALEASGIRDGDGLWHGSDPLAGLVNKLRELAA